MTQQRFENGEKEKIKVTNNNDDLFKIMKLFFSNINRSLAISQYTLFFKTGLIITTLCSAGSYSMNEKLTAVATRK